MKISLLTILKIQANEVEIVDTSERTEAWMMKDGHPHCLLLSCPHVNKPELEALIAKIKAEVDTPLADLLNKLP